MPPVNSKPRSPLPQPVLEDEHEDAVGGADREQVEHDRLGGDHERAEGRPASARTRRASTKPNTSGATVFIWSLKSFDCGGGARDARPRRRRAAPTVAGTMSSRSAARAAFEVASVPLPSTGIEMFATVLSRVDVDVDRLVHDARVESARRSSCVDRLLHLGASTSGALTTTFAPISVPGNAALSAVVGRQEASAGSESMLAAPCAAGAPGPRARRSSPPASSDRQHGSAQDAVDDRAPDPALAVVAAQPVDERHAHAVDPVAELGQHARGAPSAIRASRPRRRSSSRRANDAKPASPVRNMPGHRDDDGAARR